MLSTIRFSNLFIQFLLLLREWHKRMIKPSADIVAFIIGVIPVIRCDNPIYC